MSITHTKEGKGMDISNEKKLKFIKAMGEEAFENFEADKKVLFWGTQKLLSWTCVSDGDVKIMAMDWLEVPDNYNTYVIRNISHLAMTGDTFVESVMDLAIAIAEAEAGLNKTEKWIEDRFGARPYLKIPYNLNSDASIEATLKWDNEVMTALIEKMEAKSD